MFKLLLFLSSFLVATVGWARTYPLPADNSRLIGENSTYVVKKGDTLATIANRFDIGFLALQTVNPNIDPFLPKPGRVIKLPLQMLLPEGERKGIVVNLAQLRLFYFRPKAHKVDVFPIGIGRIGWDTPVTTTHISQKIPHPTWTPTANIRKEYEAKGKTLPKVVPAGPDNPLGDYALRLAYGVGDYLIHGTNKNFGVGLRVSSGCMRLYPKDIKYLFGQVSVNEQVRIIDEPIQYSREPDGHYYLEVTHPLSATEDDQKDSVNFPTNRKILAFITQSGINSRALVDTLKARLGIPVVIGQQKKAP